MSEPKISIETGLDRVTRTILEVSIDAFEAAWSPEVEDKMEPVVPAVLYPIKNTEFDGHTAFELLEPMPQRVLNVAMSSSETKRMLTAMLRATIADGKVDAFLHINETFTAEMKDEEYKNKPDNWRPSDSVDRRTAICGFLHTRKGTIVYKQLMKDGKRDGEIEVVNERAKGGTVSGDMVVEPLEPAEGE